jgi:hypothetical protein
MHLGLVRNSKIIDLEKVNTMKLSNHKHEKQEHMRSKKEITCKWKTI